MAKTFNMSLAGLSGSRMVFTVLRAPVVDRAGDCRHVLEQRLQEHRDVGAGGQVGALPGPQRQQIRASCSRCRDRQMSDQSALERIRQNLSARLVELLHQGVVDTARQSSGEASCQARVSRIAAQECFSVRSTGTGFLAREEY